MLRFTLRQLEYLIACVDTGSLVGAAKQLGVSQPSVSTAIAKLEQQLGVQLLIRQHAQGVVPSANGSPHIHTARNLLAHAQEFQVATDASMTDISGVLSLGSFSSLAPTYLPGLVAEIQCKYPDVELKISDGTQGQLVDGLRGGLFQMALAYDFELPDDLHKTDLLDVVPQVLLPENHRLAKKARVSLADLAQEPMVLLDVSPSRRYFTGLLEKQGITPNIAYRSSSLELVRGLVGQGLGYSILVTRPPGDLTYDGRHLELRPLADIVDKSRIVLCRLRSTRPTRLMLAFEELACDWFANQQP